jgi:hypothetical protein
MSAFAICPMKRLAKQLDPVRLFSELKDRRVEFTFYKGVFAGVLQKKVSQQGCSQSTMKSVKYPTSILSNPAVFDMPWLRASSGSLALL